ncbi:MAG: hypothetical protein KDC87_03590 [Planctomycetes bacterium]|nr:hypothetical protein [Planctomycetota bacterium]MCB9869487.1 hypothetical protein [Planctomycetota bacterium]
MTQLDVPVISFNHYLDLLRRRTWHVVIVSVLGLVVGGVVALLIPRYYVAETHVQFNRPIADRKLGSPEDPMAQVVSAAMVTVPSGVERAIQGLGWPEGTSGDIEARRAFVASVRRRVRVADLGPAGRMRQIARLAIVYADTDGHRAANMANRLREIWLKEFVDRLEQRATEDVQAVVHEIDNVTDRKVEAARELAQYEEEHGLDPQNANDPKGERSALSREIQELQRSVDRTDGEIMALTLKIQHRQGDRDVTSPTLPVPPEERFADEAAKQEFLRLSYQFLAVKKTLAGIKPAHPGYAANKRLFDRLREQLAQLEGTAGGPAAPKPNPAYTEIEHELRGLASALAVAKQTKIALEKRLAEKLERRKRMPAIFTKYTELRSKLTILQQREESLNNDLAERNKVILMIRSERPVQLLEEAFVPSRPTEPNPYLLALIGCVVGLGLAVGLVILIDLMQLTYKSVAEVESGLGLPVLGSMSHMETDTEVMASRDRRARLTILGVTFLLLLLIVVVIYYVSPTSLPNVVREMLDFLLTEQRQR